MLGAGVQAFLLAAIPGATLMTLAARRPAIERCNPVAPAKAGWSLALLFVLGAILAAFVLSTGLVLLIAIAAAVTFAPWTRLAYSQAHPAISCAVTLCGFASVMALGQHAVDLMFLLLAAWVFGTCACCALLLRFDQQRRLKQETSHLAAPQP